MFLRPADVARQTVALFRVPPLEELSSEPVRYFRQRELSQFGEGYGFGALWYLCRYHLMLNMIRRIGGNLHILDVGCGQGNLAGALAEAGHDVVASDLRPEVLEYASRKYRTGKIEWLCANAESLSFGPVFDLVVLGEILEHAAHPDRLLSGASSVLKPGGHVLITTPNGRYFSNPLPSYYQRASDEELESRQFRPSGEGHLFLFKAAELSRLVREAGLEPGPVSYYGTPFITGAVKFRHVGRFLPVTVLRGLEHVARRLPWVRSTLCLGLAMLARLDPAAAHGSLQRSTADRPHEPENK